VKIRYRFRAATATGEVLDGVLDAPSPTGALDALRRRQLIPIEVLEVTTREGRHLRRRFGRRRAVAAWARTFATLVGAAVPVDRALAATAAQVADPELATALRETRRAVREGETLADALGRHPRLFPPLVTAMVAAGETSGSLEPVLEQLARHLEEAADLRSQLQTALLYPALMAAVGSVGVIILLLFVVPRFTTVLAEVGGTLPLSTRVLITISAIVTGGWWLWLPVLVAAAFGIREVGRRPEWHRKWHAQRLSWPLLGELEVTWITARFCTTLGMLLRAGTPVIPALAIARAAVTNVATGEGLERATTAIAEGDAVAPALAGLVTPLAIQMLAAGEESGRLDEMCIRVGEAHDAELRRALRAAVALVEPVLIVAFGVLVGFVALAMLQAIYSVNTSIL